MNDYPEDFINALAYDVAKKTNRNTEGLSEMGKKVIESCQNAYVNEFGQVIDPCHVWWSEPNDPTKWL